ncbi:MAG TPA: hypothetical protein VLS89_00440, partial [Candidatus Nanopelagicales bacterium]|nr:hypothetical protein [Candidatus Nanopelagicales bacterium]
LEEKRRVVPLAEGETMKLLHGQIQSTLKSREHRRALACMRKLPSLDAPIYYAMARCWEDLGFLHATVCFYDFANELEPRSSYEILALMALVRADALDEAVARARAITERPDVSVNLRLEATAVLYRAAGRMVGAESRSMYEDVTRLVEEAWDDPTALAPVRAMALVIAGFSYEHLGYQERALQSFDRAVAAHRSDGPLLARGLHLLRIDRARALRDFTWAAQLRTMQDWPYIYAAHHAIEAGRFAEVEQLCEAGLSVTRRPALRGRLLEWWAIAAAHLGRSPGEVTRLFEQAMDELPLDPVVRRNSRLYQASIEAERAVQASAWEMPEDIVDEAEARATVAA